MARNMYTINTLGYIYLFIYFLRSEEQLEER